MNAENLNNIVEIEIEKLFGHPNNPRKDVGDYRTRRKHQVERIDAKPYSCTGALGERIEKRRPLHRHFRSPKWCELIASGDVYEVSMYD